MDWIDEAKKQFKIDKPAHFTNFTHCDECAEHDQTLLSHDIDSIGLNELGNPGWDPICFCSDEGKKYYLPALVRLSLSTIQDEFYFDQFLFHLMSYQLENSFYENCTPVQRQYIASFLKHMIETYPEQLEQNFAADDALLAYGTWSAAQQ